MKTSSSRERGQLPPLPLIVNSRSPPGGTNTTSPVDPKSDKEKVVDQSRTGSRSPSRSSQNTLVRQASLTAQHLRYLKLAGKSLLAVLVLMGFLALCRLIASTGVLQPTIDAVSRAYTGMRRDCDKEVAAITNFQEGDDGQKRLAGQELLSVPRDIPKSSISTWFDESRSWTPAAFQARSDELESSQLKPITFSNLPAGLTGKSAGTASQQGQGTSQTSSQSSTESIVRDGSVTEVVVTKILPQDDTTGIGKHLLDDSVLSDPLLVKKILNKLVAFTSEQYRFSKLRVQGKEFQQHFIKHQKGYEACRSRVGELKVELLEQIKSHEKLPAEITKVKQDIETANMNIRGFDADIDQKNFDLNKKVQELTSEINRISQFNQQIAIALGKLKNRREEKADIEKELSRTDARYTELSNDPVISEQQGYLKSLEELQAKRLVLAGKRAVLEGRLEYAYDNKDLHGLITGLAQCDSGNLESLRLKLDEHHKATEAIQQILGEGELYKASLDDEVYAKSVKADLESLRDKAGKFERKRFEKQVAQIRQVLEGVETQLSDTDSKIASTQRKLEGLELVLTDNRVEFQRLDSKRTAQKKELATISGEISELTAFTTNLPADVQPLIEARIGLETALHTEVGDLQHRKTQETSKHSGLLHSLTSLSSSLESSSRDIAKNLRVLNLEVQSCDSQQLLLKEYNSRVEQANAAVTARQREANRLRAELQSALGQLGLDSPN